MSQNENEDEKRNPQQIKALMFKNATLQWRQPCTNCCQIFTPVICLLFTVLIREVAIENIPTQADSLYAKYPLLPIKLNNFTWINQFPELVERTRLQWVLYDVEDEISADYLGQNNGVNNASGMFSKVVRTSKTREQMNSSFKKPFTNENVTVPCFRRVNGSIDTELYTRYQFLNNEGYTVVKKTSATDKMPDGSILFKHVGDDGMKAEVRVNDLRDLDFHRRDGITGIRLRTDKNKTAQTYFTITEGFLAIMDLVSRAYARKSQNIDIESGYIYMPLTEGGTAFVDSLVNLVATILFPLSLSLLLPVFLHLVVAEKEERLIQIMRINGLTITRYWLVNSLFCFIISVLTNMVFLLFGSFFVKNAFFTQTSTLLLILVLVGWILCQIGLATLLQVFLSNSRVANIVGYLVAIWTNLIGATLSIALYQYPRELPTILTLWPTFAFNRVFYLLFTACSNDNCFQSISSITPEIERCIFIIYFTALLFFFLGIYLFEIIPQPFGVPKSPLFPFYAVFYCFKPQSQFNNEEEIEKENEIETHDYTVNEEHNFITNIVNSKEFALNCKGLSKTYDNGKKAVKELSIKIVDNEILGLLGPNGAGKTTLISMLTGMFKPSSGNAFVAGHSIANELSKVHQRMGVCPQFDILWPTLTVEEHLLFYARLKGVPRENQKARIIEVLEEVNLVREKVTKAGTLSGGMKRRLSIAISLVGNPRIVLMDEPTTGLDPKNRRHLWQVLARCRLRRSLLLTTHLMEEAETLCDRIAILTDGCIRTIAPQSVLKSIYGRGSIVSLILSSEMEPSRSISSSQSLSKSLQSDYSVESEAFFPAEKKAFLQQQMELLKNNLLKHFPNLCIEKEISGMLKVCIKDKAVSELLRGLHEILEKEVSAEWSINESSIEDVFLEVVKKYDSHLEIKASLITGEESITEKFSNERLIINEESLEKNSERSD